MKIRIYAKEAASSITFMVGEWQVIHVEKRRKKLVSFEIYQEGNDISRVLLSLNVNDPEKIVYTVSDSEGNESRAYSKRDADNLLYSAMVGAPNIDSLITGMVKANPGSKLARIGKVLAQSFLKGGVEGGKLGIMALVKIIPFGLTVLLPFLLGVTGSIISGFAQLTGLKTVLRVIK